MAAKKVKVIYQDGREEIAKVLPRAQVMAEQHFKGYKSENLVEVQFYLGWAALNMLRIETRDFETWLNLVDDVEDYEDPEEPEEPIEEIPPTLPVTSDAVSSE